MKALVTSLVLIGLLASLSTACTPRFVKEQTPPLPKEEQQGPSNNHWDSVVKDLAALKGRAAGTEHEKKAATILARKFAALDLDPLREKSNFYFQPFPIPARTSFYENGRLRFRSTGPARSESQNVVGILPGTSDKYLILSAHYDGQGINSGQIYPSANDNLSGVAAMLEVAKSLKTKNRLQLNYVFVAFGAEEMGLHGSEYFVKHLPFPKEKVLGVINLDTIDTSSGKMLLEATAKSSLLTSVHVKLQEYDFEVVQDIAPKRTTDHYPFGIVGIDAVSVMAYDWLKDNHTPLDTFEKLNITQVRLVARAISDVALSLDENLN